MYWSAKKSAFVLFFTQGVFLSSWASRIPTVVQSLDLSPGNLGILLATASCGTLAGLPLAGKAIERFGLPRSLRFATIAEVAGVLAVASALTWLPVIAVVAGSLFLLGFGIGLFDVSQNLIATSIADDESRPLVPWFHGVLTAGAIVGALLAAAMVRLGVPMIIHLALVAVAVVGSVALASLRAPKKFQVHVKQHFSRRSAWIEPRTLCLGLLAMSFSFGEGTVNDWIPVVFTDGIGVDNSLGILALALFLGCVLAGRIIGPFAIGRWGRIRVLLVLMPLVIVGSLLVVCGEGYFPFLGVALWGLGGSLGIPIVVSAAADDPTKAAARLSVASTISFSSFLWGPLLVGFLGDTVGVRQALLAVTLMVGLALGLVPTTKPRS